MKILIVKALYVLRKNGLRALFRKMKVFFIKKIRNNPDELQLIYKLLKSISSVSKIMIDVGANFGDSLRPFVEDNWKIYAVEPNSEIRKTLEHLFGAALNITIDSRAISDSPEKEVSFFSSNMSTGIGTLSKFHDSHEFSEKVEVTTLSMFCKEYNIKEVGFLKIDVEGFDYMVLKGNSWTAVKPSVVMCEFEDAKTVQLGHNYHDIANFLTAKGYQLAVFEWHPLKEYGGLLKFRQWAEYPYELSDPHAFGNIVAIYDQILFKKFKTFCKSIKKFTPLNTQL